MNSIKKLLISIGIINEAKIFGLSAFHGINKESLLMMILTTRKLLKYCTQLKLFKVFLITTIFLKINIYHSCTKNRKNKTKIRYRFPEIFPKFKGNDNES